MSAISQAISAANRSVSKRDAQSDSATVSFSSYIPAFCVAVIKDCLDIVIFFMAGTVVLLPVAIVLGFISNILFGAAILALLFLFTHSNEFFLMRFLRYFFPSVGDMIPGVNLFPLATVGVWLVYVFDKIGRAHV